MSSQAIGQRFRVSRGGCWQCGSDCRSRLAEVLTLSSVAYNVLGLCEGRALKNKCSITTKSTIMQKDENIGVSPACTKPLVMRSWRWWRKHGAKVLLFLIITSMFISDVFVGFFIVMMVTVPCGIKKVNVCWYFWYPRQLYFLLCGISIMVG